MRRLMISLCIFAGLSVSACGTTPVALKYQDQRGPTATAPGQPVVEVAAIDDRRGVDSRWLGAIRGGFGNPLKVLEADQPVTEVVRSAFQDGLRARHLLATSKAKYAIGIVIKKLDCSQYVRREAHVDLDMTLTDAVTTRQILSVPVKIDRVAGSVLALDTGVFASVEDLRQVMSDALREAVDNFLDNPALRSAVND